MSGTLLTITRTVEAIAVQKSIPEMYTEAEARLGGKPKLIGSRTTSYPNTRAVKLETDWELA